MKRMYLLALAVCLVAALSLAQDTGQAGSSSQSSTATTTTTTTKKTHRSRASKNGGMSSQLTGCLSGPNDEGVYVLKNGRYRKGVEVGGSDDLKAHVGHRVQLTGAWASGKDIGEKEGAGEAKENEARERHFKVSSIKHIADTCTVSTGKKKGAGSAAPSGF